MASTIAVRRVAVSKLVERLLSSSAPAVAGAGRAPALRAFSTDAQLSNVDYNERDVDRRPGESAVSRQRGDRDAFPGFFSDVLDPFSTRSLSQMLNLMDRMLDNPLVAARGAGGGLRRGWDVREDKDALRLCVDMPGLGKEHVKVWAEQNTLVIRGEGEPESPEEAEENSGGGRRYSSRIDLPPEAYRMDQIKAEMKNGVLKVVVPKVKEEERKDVFQVKID